VPIFNSKNQIMGVLDVDSDKLDDFSVIDKMGLEEIIGILKESF
jgi:putative methionine-R-sulfoxide reductase with GAF domain